MAKPSHKIIYKSRMHILATLFFLALPLIFMLFLPSITGLDAKTLARDGVVSLIRMVIAYAIAALLGWACAILFYRGRRATIALPVFDVLQSLPTFAILPLAVTFWGKNDLTVITFLILAIIWPVFFSVISSLKLIRRDWEEAAEISGLRGWRYVWYFLLPISFNGLITGSIIGLGDGWEALIATEIIVGLQAGLGQFYQTFSTNPTITAVGVLAFLLVIFSINKLIWLPLLDWGHQKFEE